MHVERFAAQARVDAGGAQDPLRRRSAAGPARQGRPQRLAPLRKGRVDDLERLPPVAGRAARRANVSSALSTRGCGQNTVRGTGAATRAPAYQASFALGTP